MSPTRNETPIEAAARAVFDAEQNCLGPEIKHDERHFKVAIIMYEAMAEAAVAAHAATVLRNTARDQMEERYDIVDADDNVVGTATADEAHAQGLLHRFVAGFVVDGEGRVLLQRRSLSKARGPLLFDSSIGGHVQSGEFYHQAMAREAAEELGLVGVEFTAMADIRDDSPPVENMLGRLYVASHEGPFSNWETEAERLEWMTVSEIEWMLKRFPYMFTGGFASAFEAYQRHLKAKSGRLFPPKFKMDELEAVEAQFPHSEVYVVDAWPKDDDEEHFNSVVRPWLKANAIEGVHYVTTGDPAGVTLAVRFRDGDFFARFKAACAKP